MCGRTACALAPDDICRACGYKGKDGKWRQPRWQDAPGGQKYYTSYNIGPTSHTPVLLSKSHFTDSTDAKESCDPEEIEYDPESTCEWVVQPMHWGLVPSWSQGDKSASYSMNNARSETMLTKRSFKGPLEKGRRCVVLVDGYFEWQTGSDGKKQPYFLYFPHAASDTVDDLNKATEEARVYTGPRILTLAGLFDIWRPKNGEAPLYSYSIITVDAHKSLSWLHERMPAVLDGEEDIRAWIDSGTVPLTKAAELIKPRPGLHYHPVSSYVGNVRNKGDECVKPVDLEKEKRKQTGASASMMKSWLSKGKKRTSEVVTQPESHSSQLGDKTENTDQSENSTDMKESPQKKSKVEDS